MNEAFIGMNIGVLKFSLRLPENQSLKGKRQIVKSVIAQLINRYRVSAAEVEDNDLWQIATIAVVLVSNDKRHTNEVLTKSLALARDNSDAELTESSLEIIDY